MLTRVRTHAKPVSASPATLTSIRSSAVQGNESFMQPLVEQDFSRERLCQPVPTVSAASGSSREDAADHAADIAIARRPMPDYPPAPVTSTEPGPSTAPAQLRASIEPIGAPLPASVRKDMEQRFGHDFSRVRVATDREADRLVRGLGARAFAHGENIAFAAASEPAEACARHL